MPNLKKIYVIGVAATAVLAVVLTVVLVLSLNQNAVESAQLGVYYYNRAAFRMEEEKHDIVEAGEAEILEMAVNLLFSTPRNIYFECIVPQRDGFLRDYQLTDGTLLLNFTSDYYTLAPLDEALFRASLVWTVTALPFVEQVLFRVEDTDLKTSLNAEPVYFNRANVEINPVISWQLVTPRTFTLYFINADATGLVKREITVENVDMGQTESGIVQQLIDGPGEEGLLSVIPPDTKIRTITIEEGTCFVNLSAEFENKFNGSAELARLMLYSIVNSLTESSNMTGIRRVKFMIESDQKENFHDITDFNLIFEKDESLALPEA